SNLVAGVAAGADGNFGTADDAKISGTGTTDSPTIISKIASITINGQVLGTVGGTDHYGFVAELIGAFSVGGTAFPLHAGPDNDVCDVGATGDVTVREV